MYTWKELQIALDLYEKWDYRSTGEPMSFRRWLQSQIKKMPRSFDCMCNHTECICLEKDWVCPDVKELMKLWEIVENIDDTCQNWYIRRWIPEALKLIHKILNNQHN